MTALEQARQTVDEVDRQMAELFVRRMDAVRVIGAYKKEHGLPVFDPEREKTVLENGAAAVPEAYRAYFVRLLSAVTQLSREFQETL